MSEVAAPYGRLDRVLGRLDFSWGSSGAHLDYIADHDLWGMRFRPGGPHGLWIAGHLAFYERLALKLYGGIDSNPLAAWKDLFGNGSPCLDDLGAYPEPAEIRGELASGRKAIRECVAGFSTADLERTVTNERLAIRDIQSHISFLVWHDSHHGAQLGAIANNHKDSLA